MLTGLLNNGPQQITLYPIACLHVPALTLVDFYFTSVAMEPVNRKTERGACKKKLRPRRIFTYCPIAPSREHRDPSAVIISIGLALPWTSYDFEPEAGRMKKIEEIQWRQIWAPPNLWACPIHSARSRLSHLLAGNIISPGMTEFYEHCLQMGIKRCMDSRIMRPDIWHCMREHNLWVDMFCILCRV